MKTTENKPTATGQYCQKSKAYACLRSVGDDTTNYKGNQLSRVIVVSEKMDALRA